MEGFLSLIAVHPSCNSDLLHSYLDMISNRGSILFVFMQHRCTTFEYNFTFSTVLQIYLSLRPCRGCLGRVIAHGPSILAYMAYRFFLAAILCGRVRRSWYAAVTPWSCRGCHRGKPAGASAGSGFSRTAQRRMFTTTTQRSRPAATTQLLSIAHDHLMVTHTPNVTSSGDKQSCNIYYRGMSHPNVA
jgi:hypothetical protein